MPSYNSLFILPFLKISVPCIRLNCHFYKQWQYENIISGSHLKKSTGGIIREKEQFIKNSRPESGD